MDENGFEAEDDNFLTCSNRVQLYNSSREVADSSGSGLPVFGAAFSRIWNLYITANTKPLSAIILLFLVIGTNVALFFVAVLTHPVQIDYSLRAFEVPGHPESKKLDSVIAAREDMAKAAREDRENAHKRQRREDETPEVVIRSQYKRKWRIDLVYLALDDNIFTENKLKYIHNVERMLMNHKKFQNFCWKSKEALKDKPLANNFKGCMPPNSLIEFFFRTDYFDGQSETLSNVQETLDYLLTKVSTFWYVDESFSADFRKSKYLRSQLHFGIPLPGYTDSEESVKEQHKIFQKFLVDYVKQLGSSNSDQVTVLYGSSEIYDYEIKHTFYHDVLFAAISFGLIVFLLFILTSFSIWLTIFGVMTIVFSVPFSYFVYRVLLRIDTIGILTGTTVFVIIGIGVDDVFVFINVFRAAKHLKDSRERMKHLIVTAGKATFFTSFTTAAAFGANALTKVPAVHDFGIFTCILVMSCWLMVVLLMPPCLFLWDKWFIKCEMCLCFNSCCHRVVGDVQMENLISEDDIGIQFNEQQMVELNQAQDNQSGSDIIVVNNRFNHSSQNEASTDCCTITNALTKLMDVFIAKPILKYRYVVLVMYFIITGLSIGAITQLKTASGRPELFPPNTNLQKLLNLQFNFSSGYVDCSSCSSHLKPVHDPVRARRYAGLRSPVRRSLDNLDLSMNHTKEATFISPYKSSTKANASIQTTIASLTVSNKATRMYGVNRDSKANSSLSSAGALGGSTDERTATNANTATSAYPNGVTFVNGTVKGNDLNGVSATIRSPMTIVSHESVITVASEQTRRPTVPNVSQSSVRYTLNTPTTTPKTAVWTHPDTKAHGNVKSTTQVTTAKQNVVPTTLPLCPKPCTPVKRPIVDKTAIVFLVFGIKGVQLKAGNGKHFFGIDRGTPIYDEKFTMVGNQLQVVATGALVKKFCKICLAFQKNSELVQAGGSDCFPRQIYRQLKLFKYDECQSLVEPHYANGRISLSMIGVIHNKIKWMAMAFESTTYKGASAFSMMRDFKKWENFTRSVIDAADTPEMLKSGFQTSDTWVNMYSEIIAVNGAIYGITLSLVLCLAAVVIFTANWRLSLIVFMTIAGALSLVVAVFWLAGWTLGAIEAISLSILVGTSVDYTVHLTEGYIMANRIADYEGLSRKDSRREHTRMALNHIGVSIFSSALTTLLAAIPLCLTQIQLFAKFGQILALNTSMSIFYTLTICVSLLSIIGPTRFKGSIKSHLIYFLFVAVSIGFVMLLLYLLSMYAALSVPGPSGAQLFQ